MSATPIQTRSLKLVPLTLDEVRAMVAALGPAEKAQVSDIRFRVMEGLVSGGGRVGFR